MSAAPRNDVDVLIVGAGFAGAILARILVAGGRRVCLVERGSHPRFALGESTTPLANLALERLAARFGLPDLHALAVYGRWSRELPELRKGLKRGFTFYAHRRGQEYRCGADNETRLLVAASPDSEVADTQWLRADVDAHLVRRAEAEGVLYRDHTELRSLEPVADGWRCRGIRRLGVRRSAAGEEEPFECRATTLVDGSGDGAWSGSQLGVARSARSPLFESRLVYGHFEGVAPFSAVACSLPSPEDPSEPYPEQWAAVHHLLDVGWQYQLRFDNGLTSAGFLLSRDRAAELEAVLASDPRRGFYELLERYPTLARQFAEASEVRPIRATSFLQRRLERAAGRGWFLLPNTFAFHDPLFSTGIAWSLVGVERIADRILRTPSGHRVPDPDWQRYATLLQRESDHLERLIATAYALREDFEKFSSFALVYFAAASFEELRQRLADPPRDGWVWSGFLGTGDAVLCSVIEEARLRAAELSGAAFRSWLQASIAPRDAVGLATPRRRNLIPVDLDLLAARGDVLGLDDQELRARLPRLRAFL